MFVFEGREGFEPLLQAFECYRIKTLNPAGERNKCSLKDKAGGSRPEVHFQARDVTFKKTLSFLRPRSIF